MPPGADIVVMIIHVWRGEGMGTGPPPGRYASGSWERERKRCGWSWYTPVGENGLEGDPNDHEKGQHQEQLDVIYNMHSITAQFPNIAENGTGSNE
jgi:hypothetical protein